MNGYRVHWKFIILLAVIALVFMACGKQQADKRIPVDYEIEDVRNLPQDIGSYTSSYPESPLGMTCQAKLLAQFKRKFYAPWISGKPISDVAGSVATMKEYVQKAWYGENKRRIPKNVLEELLSNCDIEHLPSMGRLAIATAATDLRILPTSKPFFENAEDFPFDALQNTALKLNEPVRILHVSRDGLWVFVETAGANGWVRLRDVGYISRKMADRWMKKPQLVIVKDFALIRDKNGFVDQKAKIGTICPIVGKNGGSYKISVAARAGKHEARVIEAKVSMKSARKFPVEFSRKAIALIGNELINEPYGWGEMYQNRDCSSMIRDFYLPFGIWVPRGSANQINSGRSISLEGLGSNEKERLIKEKGVPFLTLVYLKGHIMLYAGDRNGRPLMFHNKWGITVRSRKGEVYKHVVGKAVISTLTPGSELHPVGPSLLERVTSMLVLRDRCVNRTAGSCP